MAPSTGTLPSHSLLRGLATRARDKARGHWAVTDPATTVRSREVSASQAAGSVHSTASSSELFRFYCQLRSVQQRFSSSGTRLHHSPTNSSRQLPLPRCAAQPPSHSFFHQQPVRLQPRPSPISEGSMLVRACLSGISRAGLIRPRALSTFDAQPESACFRPHAAGARRTSCTRRAASIRAESFHDGPREETFVPHRNFLPPQYDIVKLPDSAPGVLKKIAVPRKVEDRPCTVDLVRARAARGPAHPLVATAHHH